jgi:predicted ester cyclase
MRLAHITAAVTAAVLLAVPGLAVATTAPAGAHRTRPVVKPAKRHVKLSSADRLSRAGRAKRNTKIVRDYIEQVFNQHHPEMAAQFVTPDVIWHGGTLGTIPGADNLTYLLTSFIGALPDIHAAEQDVVASADLVAIRLVVTATQTGDLLGIPATNRFVRWDAVDIYRVDKAGKISEEWAVDDLAAVASQLGAITLPWAG